MLFAVALIATIGLNVQVESANSQATAERFAKYEYMIPMRDGIKLYTAVYVPKDVSGKHPILMERTPYSAGPYGPARYHVLPLSGEWYDAGYIFAYQDVRGKYMSEGDFVDVRPQLPANHGPKEIDESTDTYDTVEFLIHHVPDSDGHVGLRGISYPGFYAEMGAINNHPALVATSPQAPVGDWFLGDDWHHNGCLFLEDAFNFIGGLGMVRLKPSPELPVLQFERREPESYRFFLNTGAIPSFDQRYFQGKIPFWNEMLGHETYDSFWKARSVPDKLKNIHAAMLFVGGAFDAEDCYGALHAFAAAHKQNAATPIFFCYGPWFHGMWAERGATKFGDYNFGSPTSSWFQDNVEFPFFEKYLRMQDDVKMSALATVFETGTNKWRSFPAWPPTDAQKTEVYLDEAKRLTFEGPGRDGGDSYMDDPAEPTPYTELLTLQNRLLTYPVADQRFASKRKDVLTYTSAPLERDMTWGGPIDVDIWIKTTGTDCDLVAKVIDVFPDDSTETSRVPTPHSLAGEALLVRGDIMRAKFRNSWSNPTALTPDKPAEVKFTMDDVLHTFKKGHRLMIQIQSNWFPLVNRNPNVFTDINTAPESTYTKATITILHGSQYPSGVRFGKMASGERLNQFIHDALIIHHKVNIMRSHALSSLGSHCGRRTDTCPPRSPLRTADCPKSARLRSGHG
jgi:hypothetical protein